MGRGYVCYALAAEKVDIFYTFYVYIFLQKDEKLTYFMHSQFSMYVFCKKDRSSERRAQRDPNPKNPYPSLSTLECLESRPCAPLSSLSFLQFHSRVFFFQGFAGHNTIAFAFAFAIAFSFSIRYSYSLFAIRLRIETKLSHLLFCGKNPSIWLSFFFFFSFLFVFVEQCVIML